MSTVSQEFEQVIARLAPEDRRQRRSSLLRPLNATLITASALGLLVMVARGSDAVGFTLVGSSLLLNFGVAILDRQGRTNLAAQIFSLCINLGILLFCAANLLSNENVTVGLVFACVLAMGVMLAGMLLGARTAFLFAAVNIVSVSFLLWRHFLVFGTGPDDSPINATVSAALPVGTFLLVIAVITWLYQRTLDASEARLNVARQRIMQDELLRRDLAIARDLQRRLYPPPPLTNPGLCIASRSEPARETSGDFYDFIDLDDNQLGIVVADVTGKSIAAALMMALARATLRSAAQRHTSPAEVLRQANEALCGDHTVHQMITAFYGILDTRTLSLRFSNAGHPYPIVRRSLHLDEIELNGLPLGARSDAQYGEETLQLGPGDQLYILSDGLIEEHNSRRELFGYERLNVAILAADRAEPEHAIDDLWRAVTVFRGATEQNDDITLVVVQAAA